jgi:very-short-patch-repair endonuclease
MVRKSVHRNFALAEIAKQQHGVVTATQLRSVGLSEDATQARARRGALHRIHHGVYAVGHAALSAEGRLLAAVLAIGGGPGEASGRILDCWSAAVSHRSAAFLWGLARYADGPVDVIVRRVGGRAMRAGIRVHRSVSLAPGDVTIRRGIPVTRPARTIADLQLALSHRRAGALSAWELRRAIRQAGVLGLPLGENDLDPTRSDLEEDFLKICRRHRLPRPQINVRVGPHLVDFLWPERRVVVETDSYLYHRGRVAFQDDRGRALDLKRRGFDVLRLAEQQVNEEPEVVAEVLAATLRGGVDEKAVK